MMTDPTPAPDAPAPLTDRGFLLWLKGEFEGTTHQCETCGRADPAADCDAYGRLVEHLAALRAERDEAQPVAFEIVDDASPWARAKAAEVLSIYRAGSNLSTIGELIAAALDEAHAHPPATTPGASGCEHLALPGAKCVHCWRKEWATSPGAAGDADDDLSDDEAAAWVNGLKTGLLATENDPARKRRIVSSIEPAPAAAEVDRVRWLLAAMREAKSLLSYAGQDSVDPAIAQANKNRAWHVLNEALRSAEP